MACCQCHPRVAVYLGGGGAAMASAAGGSATGGAESPHKHTFTWLERPCHSQPLKPKCPTSRRSAHLGPVSLWTVMALAMASNMSSWQVSVKVCEPILYWAWLL
jgi:hypothetical protein